jgi:hypothetical protein
MYRNPDETSKLFYAGYAITKLFDSLTPISILIHKMETFYLKEKISKIKIKSPIYITGLARAGTTIVLEMLSKHPDLASHRYKHLLVPYIPYWTNVFTKRTNFLKEPTERIHSDGILVNRNSPEAVEEMIWQKFFDNLHNEKTSNIIDKENTNRRFEKFYYNHIRKLLVSQDKPRYLAKNNYNVTRLEYLLKLFPDSKFLLIIRNPINHIASLIKQTKLFTKLEGKIPLLKNWEEMIGHHEFGRNKVFINVGNTKQVEKIRKLLKNKKTYIEGWARYWVSIYDFVANQLDSNEHLKKSTLVIKYDELCEKSATVIDKIINHTNLSAKDFKEVKNYYIEHLHKPTYYDHGFLDRELETIDTITRRTVNRFDLEIS